MPLKRKVGVKVVGIIGGRENEGRGAVYTSMSGVRNGRWYSFRKM